MVKMINRLAILAVLALSLYSCAEEKVKSDREIQQSILDAYVDVNYPNAERRESGLVMLDYVQGTGDTLNMYEGCFLEYTTRTLQGRHIETTDEELAKRLGWYSNSKHYGPDYFELGYNNSYPGLEEAIYKMQIGGTASFIMPPWLTDLGGGWNVQTSLMYDVELVDVVENILEWQQDTMKRYAATHYPGLDTLSANFYFKKLYDAGKDTIESGNISVRYVGRLLDGWVFDTNIADTAKKYGIYDATRDYSALSVVVSENLETMVEDNSLVEGFCMALQNMSFEDKAFTMFYSEYGYSSSGSDEIGAFQPLIFWLYIEPDEAESE